MSNRELSLANAIAHGEILGYHIFFHCENCGNSLFEVKHYKEKKGERNQDIIIEREYYLKCTHCGSEECDRLMTIIPSWSAPNINRDTMEKWEDSE